MTASVHSLLLCHECPKSFENKKTLTDHLLTCPKTKEKCDKCGKFYKNRKSLKEHERNVHEGKLYSCDVCTKTFSVLGNLKKHKEIHEKTNLKKNS